MKFRDGFVSNSSGSSFIVAYNGDEFPDKQLYKIIHNNILSGTKFKREATKGLILEELFDLIKGSLVLNGFSESPSFDSYANYYEAFISECEDNVFVSILLNTYIDYATPDFLCKCEYRG